MSESIFEAGRNCWRVARARRAAFLVDGAAYYRAVADALAAAERSILILGWDLDSRVRLVRDPAPDARAALPTELGPLLAALVRRRRRLRVHLIDWDWAVVFAWEREGWPWAPAGWRTGRRLKFRFDGTHPVGASHHQKAVVVDDRVAFVGGLDLCARRWDTPEHRADDARRVDPWGQPYDPFHDVQMLVEGEAARALGDLARERWRRLTGRRLRPPRAGGDPWPRGLAPDLEDVAVAIARTEPAYDGRDEVREVEELYRDAIAAARRLIYIENQYLTSSAVGDALAVRLAEPDGPEIVIVVPTTCSGWLEEATMGVLRAGLLQRLTAADAHDRLRVLVPTVPGVANGRLNVHAKLLIVDERLVRIGSANLSNRSMGLDTECDLAVASDGAPASAGAIARLRDGLLAEHLGVARAAVETALARYGSPIRAIASLQGGERSLVPLAWDVSPWLESLVPAAGVLDPERTVDVRALEALMGGGDVRTRVLRRGVVPIALATALAAATAVWWWSPHGVPAEPSALAVSAAALRASGLAPVVVPLIYGLAGVVMFPMMVLVLATAVVFAPAPSVAYAATGVLLAALAGYGAGRLLGRDGVRRLGSRHLERLGKRLAGHGVLSLAVVRLTPVAPFALVSLVAGAIRLPLREYVVGTALGMLPGIVGLTLVGQLLGAAWREPSAVRTATLAGVAALVLAAGLGMRRLTRRPGGAG